VKKDPGSLRLLRFVRLVVVDLEENALRVAIDGDIVAPMCRIDLMAVQIDINGYCSSVISVSGSSLAK
jgi:hypothetical protein